MSYHYLKPHRNHSTHEDRCGDPIGAESQVKDRMRRHDAWHDAIPCVSERRVWASDLRPDAPRPRLKKARAPSAQSRVRAPWPTKSAMLSSGAASSTSCGSSVWKVEKIDQNTESDDLVPKTCSTSGME